MRSATRWRLPPLMVPPALRSGRVIRLCSKERATRSPSSINGQDGRFIRAVPMRMAPAPGEEAVDLGYVGDADEIMRLWPERGARMVVFPNSRDRRRVETYRGDNVVFEDVGGLLHVVRGPLSPVLTADLTLEQACEALRARMRDGEPR